MSRELRVWHKAQTEEDLEGRIEVRHLTAHLEACDLALDPVGQEVPEDRHKIEGLPQVTQITEDLLPDKDQGHQVKEALLAWEEVGVHLPAKEAHPKVSRQIRSESDKHLINQL